MKQFCTSTTISADEAAGLILPAAQALLPRPNADRKVLLTLELTQETEKVFEGNSKHGA